MVRRRRRRRCLRRRRSLRLCVGFGGFKSELGVDAFLGTDDFGLDVESAAVGFLVGVEEMIVLGLQCLRIDGSVAEVKDLVRLLKSDSESGVESRGSSCAGGGGRLPLCALFLGRPRRCLLTGGDLLPQRPRESSTDHLRPCHRHLDEIANHHPFAFSTAFDDRLALAADVTRTPDEYIQFPLCTLYQEMTEVRSSEY